MAVTKVNYNNLVVKMPVTPVPTIRYIRNVEDTGNGISETVTIIISPNTESDFWTGFDFEISINGIVQEYVNKDSDTVLTFVDDPHFQGPTFTVGISGTYHGKFGYEAEVKSFTKTFDYFNVCSEVTICSEYITVRDYMTGYYVDGEFYENVDPNSPIGYSSEMERIQNARYFDILSGGTYVYNINKQEYKRIL